MDFQLRLLSWETQALLCSPQPPPSPLPPTSVPCTRNEPLSFPSTCPCELTILSVTLQEWPFPSPVLRVPVSYLQALSHGLLPVRLLHMSQPEPASCCHWTRPSPRKSRHPPDGSSLDHLYLEHTLSNPHQSRVCHPLPRICSLPFACPNPPHL